MDDHGVLADLLRLRTAARRLDAALGAFPDVAAVLVFGSVASGTADSASDLDVLVVYRTAIPAIGERRRFLPTVGTDWITVDNGAQQLFPACDRGLLADGTRAEVHYQTAPWITAVLREVLTAGAITTERLPFRPYTLPALLQRAWVLHDGDGLVEPWREQARVYPPALQRNILDHFAPILTEQVAEFVAAAERDLGAGNCVFHLSHAWDALTSIVLAMNAVYDPADRRMHQTVIPALRVLPTDYAVRLSAILEGPFDTSGARRSARRLEQLAKETLALAKAYDWRG